ncbi:MAG TPA: response regulator [Pyrinomonadaceae bacterium]|jgi:CheY-like chemotaxis protein|nr:response regulator [Pyrinomonadaceae bacterium]
MENQTSRQPTVLIVEDIEEIRLGMKRSLSDCGYSVLEASDADEAVAIASRLPLDLILTEEELPTFALLLERTREHPSLKGLPVLIINPDAEEGMRYADAVVLADYGQLKRFLLDQVRISDQDRPPLGIS